MSHFSVLVIGPDPEKQLAPYHEFECTGEDNEFVQEIDETEECRKEYEEGTATRYRDPEGALHDPYEDRFYREMTDEEKEKHRPLGTGCGGGLSWTSKDWGDGQGYRAKVHFLPEGWTEVEVPRKETESFAAFLQDYHGRNPLFFGQERNEKHKYGFVEFGPDGNVSRVIRRTNPNAYWDWYSIGGRWTGWLKLKAGATGELGHKAHGVDDPEEGTADILKKGDIDFAGMMDEAGAKAGADWDQSRAITTETWQTWAEVQANFHGTPNEAGEFYRNQPAIKALRESDKFGFFFELDRLLVSREEYVEKARNASFIPYAIVKDSQWFAKGEMGWWGCSNDKLTGEEWSKQVAEMLLALPDDTQITCVDCHI